MASFQKAPDGLLKQPPASLDQSIKDALLRPGTYSLYDEKEHKLKVPLGNATWKGR